MNPNHYLAVAIQYLYGGARPGWPAGTAIGKTFVSSSMIDRVAADLGARLLEVPVGFKWFVPGLSTGRVGFGGEESAGASFLRKDGTVLDHRQGRHPPRAAGLRDPGDHRQVAPASTTASSSPSTATRYARVDAAASREQKATLAALTPERVTATRSRARPSPPS